MKILMVDKYYFIKGGAERYYFELTKVLEAFGHQVIPFSMQHPENHATLHEKEFVDNIEFNGLNPIQKLLRAPEIATRVIYSRKARDAVRRVIDRYKPDIAHLHMIDHQLSPSILHAFRDAGIPVIQTCHQYKLVCPSYRLFVMHQNKVCERCVSGGYHNAIWQRCHKASLPASALIAFESYVHKWMKIYDHIDLFHVPSRFLGQKLIEGGFPAKKIWHAFYTINLDDYPYHPQAKDYFVYFGRLSEEKGCQTLLKAMQKAPDANLLMVGDGPYRPQLEAQAQALGLENVRFAGNRGGQDLISLVQNARFIVVPSEWYDNSPLVIYEAFSMGKPAIVSRMGGMPELVDDGENGYHFNAGDAEQLADRINALWGSPEKVQRFGKAARDKALTEFHPEAHYKKMLATYHGLLAGNSESRPVENLQPPVESARDHVS